MYTPSTAPQKEYWISHVIWNKLGFGFSLWQSHQRMPLLPPNGLLAILMLDNFVYLSYLRNVILCHLIAQKLKDSSGHFNFVCL